MSGAYGCNGGLCDRTLLGAHVSGPWTSVAAHRTLIRQAVCEEPKSDMADAEAIAEEGRRSTLRFVEVNELARMLGAIITTNEEVRGGADGELTEALAPSQKCGRNWRKY